MRKEALVPGLMAICWFATGCGLMPGGRNFPGIVEPNPYAVNQSFSLPAFRVAQAMRDVLASDPFYKDVSLVAEPRSRGSRPLTRDQKAALGPNSPSRDVNFALTAKTVNNHRVAAVIQLKGEAGSEASVLFDTSGDPAMSRSVLQSVEARLAGVSTADPESATKPESESSAELPELPTSNDGTGSPG
ncbi:hypothetical protein TA3x_004637 [Tundrisphaera sp. TA3]|uniref:hypothetical protein n=1 Tax=Tundrisphaera sp. TA3 TaxID=3435775 RepID=UPI003EBB7235